MPVTIQSLECTVTVTSGSDRPIEHQGHLAERPALDYVLPTPVGGAESEQRQSHGGSSASSEEMTTEGGSVTPRNIDARQVTDRVYELLKRELQDARMRGGYRGRNAGK